MFFLEKIFRNINCKNAQCFCVGIIRRYLQNASKRIRSDEVKISSTFRDLSLTYCFGFQKADTSPIYCPSRTVNTKLPVYLEPRDWSKKAAYRAFLTGIAQYLFLVLAAPSSRRCGLRETSLARYSLNTDELQRQPIFFL